MKNYHINNKQNGLTLIEILVAMVIGLFLLAGVMQIFLGSQQSYRLQENLSRMQENGRFAMDFITRDIRMAGSTGCVEINNIKNMLNSDPNLPFNDFGEGVSGEDGVNNTPDEITINSMLPSDIFVTKIPGSSQTFEQLKVAQAAALQVTKNTVLNEKDVVMVTNCDKGDIFQITNINSSGENLVHKTGNATEPGNSTKKFSLAYDSTAQIYRPNFVTYSIYTPTGGTVSLARRLNGANKQALVENIEDMQILYGEDTKGDNTPNYYVSADQVTNMEKVISIRISLLVISPDDNLVSNITPYTYNGVEITPTDRRLRQVVSSTIAIRNKLP